jgi:hypothetical protein
MRKLALCLILATAGVAACKSRPSAMTVCNKLEVAGVAEHCKSASPGGIGGAASERVTFDLLKTDDGDEKAPDIAGLKAKRDKLQSELDDDKAMAKSDRHEKERELKRLTHAIKAASTTEESSERPTGQVLAFQSSGDYEKTVKAFEAMSTLAGRHRYGSPGARVFVQMNVAARDADGETAKKIVDAL